MRTDTDSGPGGAGSDPDPPPAIAVIIPTYNRASMVAEAVESALAQRVPTRTLVVDDGSTDDTLPLLERRFGSEITLLARVNAERGAARNAGAQAAPEADLLIFLDADDRLLPGHLETVLELHRLDPFAPLHATRVRVVDETLHPLELHPRMIPGRIGFEDFLRGDQALPPSCCAISRPHFEALGGFEEARELAGSEDWLLHARLLLRGDAVRSDRVTVEMRRHPGNTMAASHRMERAMRGTRGLLFGRYAPELRERVRERVREPGTLQVTGEVARLERLAQRAMLRNLAATHYGAGAMKAARSAAREATGGGLAALLADPELRRSWLRSWLGGRLTGALRSLRARLRRLGSAP